MEKEEKKESSVIMINGKQATPEFYVGQCEELTSIANHLKFITNSLSNVAYQQSKGDHEAVAYFMRANFSCLVDNLQDIGEEIQKISNESCPD